MLSSLRILSSPVLGWLVLQENFGVAIALFAAMGATDVVST